MNKSDLIDRVVKAVGVSRVTAEKTVNAVVAATSKALSKGERVQIKGLGSFEVRKRQARKGRHPQTGAPIKIKARKVPVFRPGKALRDSVI